MSESFIQTNFIGCYQYIHYFRYYHHVRTFVNMDDHDHDTLIWDHSVTFFLTFTFNLHLHLTSRAMIWWMLGEKACFKFASQTPTNSFSVCAWPTLFSLFGFSVSCNWPNSSQFFLLMLCLIYHYWFSLHTLLMNQTQNFNYGDMSLAQWTWIPYI